MLRTKNALLFWRWLFGISVVGLVGLGVVMLYSTSSATDGEAYLKKQVQWLAVGGVFGFMAYLVGYRWFCRWRWWLLFAGIVPVAYLGIAHTFPTLSLPCAPSINGAHRWLSIGGQSVQPSEFAKLAVVLFLAGYYGAKPHFAARFRTWWKPVLGVGVLIGSIVLQRSLSVTVICSMLLIMMMFLAGLQLRYVLGGLIGVVCIVIVMSFLSTNVKDRLNWWKEPGYQLKLSLIALGSGHWTGVGINNSRMKEAYLPEKHTDFIVSIIGEELGFVAVVSVILLYLLLGASAFGISAATPDATGQLAASGLGLMLWLPSFVHIGVVVGALPTTGIAAPLLSYGGSTTLVSSIAIGLLLCVARESLRVMDENPQPKPREPVRTEMVPA